MMKTHIEVADRKEGELIRRGLNDPQTRALVKVMGALSTLPTRRTQLRVMRFVDDYFAERGN
jgi:hypothetical protein